MHIIQLYYLVTQILFNLFIVTLTQSFSKLAWYSTQTVKFSSQIQIGVTINV